MMRRVSMLSCLGLIASKLLVKSYVVYLQTSLTLLNFESVACHPNERFNSVIDRTRASCPCHSLHGAIRGLSISHSTGCTIIVAHGYKSITTTSFRFSSSLKAFQHIFPRNVNVMYSHNSLQCLMKMPCTDK